MFFWLPLNIVEDPDSSTNEEEASDVQALVSPSIEAVGVQRPSAWAPRLKALFSRQNVDARVRQWQACQSSRAADGLWREVEQAVRTRVRSQNARFQLPQADLDDLQQDIQVQLWPCLEPQTASHVRDYDAFVNVVVRNAFRRRIREGKPVWTGLKDEVVEVLRGKRGVTGFAVWKSGKQELCGYAAWESSEVRPTAGYLRALQDTRAFKRLVTASLDPRSETPDLIKAVFDYVGTPMSVNDLTTLLFDLRSETERGSVPLEPCHEQKARVESPEASALRNAALASLAPAFIALPRERAAAFFFHLPGPVAECLLMRLGPYAESAALVSSKLGIETERLECAMDEEMPWRDLRIAEFLGIERPTGIDAKKADHAVQQAVINLRQAAIRSIRQTMEDRPA